jgi:hypothetical protein
MTFAAMRAARATNLGPILRVASVPELLNRHDWRAAGSDGLLANVDVVVADGSHARY